MEFRLVAKLDQNGRVESVTSSCNRLDGIDTPDGPSPTCPTCNGFPELDLPEKSFPYAQKKELTSKLHSKIDEMSIMMIQVEQLRKTNREMQKRLRIQEKHIELLQAQSYRSFPPHSEHLHQHKEPVEHEQADSSNSSSCQRLANDVSSPDSSSAIDVSQQNGTTHENCNSKSTGSISRCTQTNSLFCFCGEMETAEEEFKSCFDESACFTVRPRQTADHVDQNGYVILSNITSQDVGSTGSVAELNGWYLAYPPGRTLTEKVPSETGKDTSEANEGYTAPVPHKMPHYHEIDQVSLRKPLPVPRRPVTLAPLMNNHGLDNKALVDKANARLRESSSVEGNNKVFAHRHSCPDLRRGDSLNSLVQKMRTTQEWDQAKRTLMDEDKNISKSTADETLTKFVQDMDCMCTELKYTKTVLRRHKERIIQDIEQKLFVQYGQRCLNDEFISKFLDLWNSCLDRFSTP